MERRFQLVAVVAGILIVGGLIVRSSRSDHHVERELEGSNANVFQRRQFKTKDGGHAPTIGVEADQWTTKLSLSFPAAPARYGVTTDGLHQQSTPALKQECPVCDCPHVEEQPRNTSEPTKKRFEIETHAQMNWFEAFVHCKERGGQLATIENKEQNDELVALIESVAPGMDTNQKKAFWVGAIELGEEGKWYWLTTGKSVEEYTNWVETEPNNHLGVDEQCLNYLKYPILKVAPIPYYGWNDQKCTNKHFLVCEFSH